MGKPKKGASYDNCNEKNKEFGNKKQNIQISLRYKGSSIRIYDISGFEAADSVALYGNGI